MPTTDAEAAPRDEVRTADERRCVGTCRSSWRRPRVADPHQAYTDAFESIELAEALGYGFAWIAEAHFSSHFGIPAALPFLAAVTQRVSRIALGTAVIPLAFEVPLRLAESAALVNVLTHDRLELGVGKGNPTGRPTPTTPSASTRVTATSSSQSRSEALKARAARGNRHR